MRKFEAISPALRFWIATQAIIVGLAVQAALEQIHDNVSPGLRGGEAFSLERTLVYAAFTILLIRFYAGAFRFGELRTVANAFVCIKNLLGASASFSLFYLMGASVNETPLFIEYVILLHIADLIWFVATYWHNRRHDIAEKVKIATFFLGLSSLSLAVLLLWPSNAGRLLFLIGISAVDFLILAPYYFGGEPRFMWERKATATATATTA